MALNQACLGPGKIAWHVHLLPSKVSDDFAIPAA